MSGLQLLARIGSGRSAEILNRDIDKFKPTSVSGH